MNPTITTEQFLLAKDSHYGLVNLLTGYMGVSIITMYVWQIITTRCDFLTQSALKSV